MSLATGTGVDSTWVNTAASAAGVSSFCVCARLLSFVLLPCWICMDLGSGPSVDDGLPDSSLGDSTFADGSSVTLKTPHIFVERTLAMIKPDAVNKNEEIEDIIQRSGFTILNVGFLVMGVTASI
jgi:hypothetical protein